VGLGDGINEGEEVGIGVEGNPVGAGEGMAEGIEVGEGDGIKDGLIVGFGVVGDIVGEGVGRGVGAQVSQYSSNINFTGKRELYAYASQGSSPIGGVFCHCSSSSLKMATLPFTDMIAHFFEV